MTTERQDPSRTQVVLRAVFVAVASTFVGAVSAFIWYMVNAAARLSGFLSPTVGADLSVSPAPVPSPFPPAFAIAGVEVLIAVAVVAWMLAPAFRQRLSLAAIVMGPLALWVVIAVQFAGSSLHWAISSPEMMFVLSAQELTAVGLVLLLPPIAAAGTVWVSGRQHRGATA